MEVNRLGKPPGHRQDALQLDVAEGATRGTDLLVAIVVVGTGIVWSVIPPPLRVVRTFQSVILRVIVTTQPIVIRQGVCVCPTIVPIVRGRPDNK